MSSSLTIEERVNLDHFKIWFSYLINIVNKYPEIKKYKCVKESLQVSKYFLANLSRFIINFTKLSNKKKESESLIINIYDKNISKNQYLYHLDIIKEYSSDSLRLALVSFASPDSNFNWDKNVVVGSQKFVSKVYYFLILSCIFDFCILSFDLEII